MFDGLKLGMYNKFPSGVQWEISNNLQNFDNTTLFCP